MSKEKLKKEYWITPPEVYKALNDEFHFDFDPCPYPYAGVCATEIEWGQSSYVNPPFRAADGQNGKGPTAIIRKAIEENKKGKTVVVTINTMSFINLLLEAGAEVRSLGRVKWLDGRTGQAWNKPSNTTCFILRGPKHRTHPKPLVLPENVIELLKDYASLLESDYRGSGNKDLSGGEIEMVNAAIDQIQKLNAGPGLAGIKSC